MSVWANIIDRSYRKKDRLTKPKDFRYLFQNARRRTSKYFTVLYCKNSCGYPRLGVTVSRKCAKSAVVRNRIKRLIREHFRHNKNMSSRLDIVFIARPGAALKTNNELSKDINEHFSFLKDRKS